MADDVDVVSDAQALGLLRAVSIVNIAAGAVLAMLTGDDEGAEAGLQLVDDLGGADVLAVALVATNQLSIDPMLPGDA